MREHFTRHVEIYQRNQGLANLQFSLGLQRTLHLLQVDGASILLLIVTLVWAVAEGAGFRIISIREGHTRQKNKGCSKKIIILIVGGLLFVIGIVAIAALYKCRTKLSYMLTRGHYY